MAKVPSRINLKVGQASGGGSPGTDTFNEVGHLTDVSQSGGAKNEIDATDFDSTAREFFGTLPDAGSIEFEGFRDVGDVGQDDATHGVRVLQATQAEQRNIKIEYLDPSDDSVLETADFIGEVMEFNVGGTQDNMLTISGRIKISGEVTYT